MLSGIFQNDLNDVLDSFKTVFIVNNDQLLPKHKGIIPLQDISFASQLNDIDVVFVNHGYDENRLQFLAALLRRSYPTVFVNVEFPIETEYRTFFAKLRYEQTDALDQYQVWKVIR
jgi:hypothetical protein